MHLDDTVRGESARGELGDISLGSTGLAIQVKGDLFPSEVQLEGLSQLVLDDLLGRCEAEIVTKGSLYVSLGRSCEAVDSQSRDVAAGVTESEHVVRRSGRGVCDGYRPALLPLAQSLGGGSLDTLSEDEVDLVRSGGDLIKADVLESLELLLLRAGPVGRGHVVDAYLVVLWVDAEPDQNVELEFRSPGWYGLGALWVGQLEGLVVCDLVGCRLLTGEGARADVDGCVNLWTAKSRCHGDFCAARLFGLW